jgi:hypothetical protein
MIMIRLSEDNNSVGAFGVNGVELWRERVTPAYGNSHVRVLSLQAWLQHRSKIKLSLQLPRKD